MKKNNITFNITIIIGIILLSYILWIRFIRERLPRDIPFNFTFFGLIIILVICISFVYQLIQITKPINILQETPQNFLNLLIISIYKLYATPLYILQKTIINNKYIYPIINKLLKYILNVYIYFSLYKNNRYITLYLFCSIIPRYLLLMFFVVDIFYFHKLEICYNFLFIGLIPMISSFFIKSSDIIFEKYCEFLEKNFLIELDPEDQTENSNYYFDILDLRPHPDFNDEMLKHILEIRYFIEIQSASIWFDYDPYNYKCIETWEARLDYARKFNIVLSPIYIISSDLDEISKEISKDFYILMPFVINLKLFLLTQRNNFKNKLVRKFLIVINIIYIICWIYILLTGNYENIFSSITIEEICVMINKTWKNIKNPFND